MITRLLILFLLLLPAATARATADGVDCWNVRGVAPNDVLNMRARPDLQSKIVGKIPAGATNLANANDAECPDTFVRGIPECFGPWGKVGYKGIVGWVKYRFLEVGEDCD